MSRRLFPPHPVLIVDDDTMMLRSLKLTLRAGGITNVETLSDSREVVPMLRKCALDAVLLDITMPHIGGDRLLQAILEESPGTSVIMVTGDDTVEMAVTCMKQGAVDYMVKPIEKNRLLSGVRRALDIRHLENENRLLASRFSDDRIFQPEHFAAIITRNKSMQAIFKYAEAVAASPRPVLITGATGTGKELMARAIHQCARADQPFVSINIAGIDATVFADTLFGHVKGAYTGADTGRSGLIQQAGGGTLFLDEIGELDPDSQKKLLRLLQEGEYFRLGDDQPRMMDTRIIAATNRPQDELKDSSRFRKDLYYRLSAHYIHLPPLYERRDDLPLLLNALFKEAAAFFDKPAPAVPKQQLTLLSTYHFPGNVRELKSMIFDAVCIHRSKKLSLATFAEHISQHQPDETNPSPSPLQPHNDFSAFTVLPSMEHAQYLLIREALARTGNNQSMAAKMLGISRQRLARRLKSEPGH